MPWTALASGSAYSITVKTQPSSPTQTCVVGNATGSVAGAAVTTATVTCTTNTYGINGTITGLAGSGPAYLFLVAEALMDAGVLAGLSRANSVELVTQLMVGSAALLADRGDPAALRAMVTSPGGTTDAGVRVLEQRAVRAAVIDAVLAARDRAVELA